MGSADRYTTGEYLECNPDWHVTDSPWKCDKILELLGDGAGIASICEVGCGAGEILRQLHDRVPSVRTLVGYEIAEAALQMAASRATERLSFRLADAAGDDQRFDLMLIMDVIEHVSDPIGFLASLRFKADRAMIHIPLDLSAQSVMRPNKLLTLRSQVGHIHYYTLETALAAVIDAGYDIQRFRLTHSFDLPYGGFKAWVARWPRRFLPERVSLRLLGGFSVLVDAKPTSGLKIPE